MINGGCAPATQIERPALKGGGAGGGDSLRALGGGGGRKRGRGLAGLAGPPTRWGPHLCSGGNPSVGPPSDTGQHSEDTVRERCHLPGPWHLLIPRRQEVGEVRQPQVLLTAPNLPWGVPTGSTEDRCDLRTHSRGLSLSPPDSPELQARSLKVLL